MATHWNQDIMVDIPIHHLLIIVVLKIEDIVTPILLRNIGTVDLLPPWDLLHLQDTSTVLLVIIRRNMVTTVRADTMVIQTTIMVDIEISNQM